VSHPGPAVPVSALCLCLFVYIIYIFFDGTNGREEGKRSCSRKKEKKKEKKKQTANVCQLEVKQTVAAAIDRFVSALRCESNNIILVSLQGSRKVFSYCTLT